MEIFLDNIGLIQNSTVKLDGLTVITGENNSGKSTVGKVLYAITDGMIDIDLKQERDEFTYCRRIFLDKLRLVIQNLHRFNSASYDDLFLHTDKFDTEASPSAMEEVLSRNFITEYNTKEEFLFFINKLIDELHHIKPSPDALEHNFLKKNGMHKKPIIFFEELQKDALNLCEKAREILVAGTDKHKFIEIYMNHTLRNEFQGEIQPVRKRETTSKINFQDAQGTLFSCNIEDDNILSNNFTSLSYVFTKSFFIDNAFVLDQVRGRPFFPPSRSIRDDESIVDIVNILSHTEKLIRYLSMRDQHNITHELDITEKYITIKEKITPILPGEFKHTPQGLKYEYEGVSLKAANLATGSKMFAIIKMILDRYGFDDSTMLILDEPEAHLHPKWQNIFAELIVLLVKELDVRVLLTSHSPNFVLALDANMRKHEIIEKTNFYKTSMIKDGFVQYEAVNENLTVIYDDFAAYFAEALNLRDRLFYGEE